MAFIFLARKLHSATEKEKPACERAGRRGSVTAVIVTGSEKEIADLIREVQGQRIIKIKSEIDAKTIVKAIRDISGGKAEIR